MKQSRKHKLKSSEKLILALLIFAVIVGIAMIFYPLVSTIYSSNVQSKVSVEYQNQMNHMDTSKQDAIWREAEKFNSWLLNNSIDKLDYTHNGYLNQLVTPETEIMCYIRIPKIGVKLPVFHTVKEDSLHSGAGHLPQSSLPIGGPGTHSVISAHTGMAESVMFTELDELGPGDVFFIDVLGRTLKYEVMSEDDITIVLPSDVDNIGIQRDSDFCTLITCTPYGINSHRLLVKGTRVELREGETGLEDDGYDYKPVEHKSLWMKKYLSAIGNGVAITSGLALVAALIYLLYQRKKRKKRLEELRHKKAIARKRTLSHHNHPVSKGPLDSRVAPESNGVNNV